MLELGTDAEISPEISVIRLKGALDSSTARDFRAFFSDLIEQNHLLFILESTGLVCVSSAGISSLIDFSESLRRRGGAAVFIGLNSEIKLLMDFSGLSARICYTGSLTEAEGILKRGIAGGLSNIEMAGTGLLRNGGNGDRMRVRFREVTARVADEAAAGMSAPLPSQMYRIRRETDRRPERRAESTSAGRGIEMDSGPLENPEGEIILCEQCGAHLRIKKAGPHLCPSCKIRFVVKRDGSVSFYEKLEK